MSRKRKTIIASAVFAAAAALGTLWTLTERDDPHDRIRHVPDRARPPVRRGPEPATMRQVRKRLGTSLQAAGFKSRPPIFIRVFKHSYELEVWVERGGCFAHFRTYPICSFSGDLGPKLAEGDLQAPEGFYYVRRRQLNPASSYHLAYNIGYPNAYDRAHKRTGGHIMIHGSCASAGCLAMTDDKIEEIYALAEDALDGGQPFFRVHIFPFRMTPAQLRKHENPKWKAFWANLKQGYDWFEQHGRPPDVNVDGLQYTFKSSRPKGGKECEPVQIERAPRARNKALPRAHRPSSEVSTEYADTGPLPGWIFGAFAAGLLLVLLLFLVVFLRSKKG